MEHNIYENIAQHTHVDAGRHDVKHGDKLLLI